MKLSIVSSNIYRDQRELLSVQFTGPFIAQHLSLLFSFMQHPGQLLQQELTTRWLTQKTFATMIGKKISEVNELIKWKRNITVQRDILLSIVFRDPEQKRLKLQNDFDYIITKEAMAPKIEELFSYKQKTKEHEVFEDF